MTTNGAQSIQNMCSAGNNIIDVGIIERLYVTVHPYN